MPRMRGDDTDESRELIFKEDGQDYAHVLRVLDFGAYGDRGCCEAMCFNDGTKRVCHIRGRLHRRNWIDAGDIILVILRDHQDDDKEADVILKYTVDEVRLLRTYGELPDSVRLNEDDIADNGLDEKEFDKVDLTGNCPTVCGLTRMTSF